MTLSDITPPRSVRKDGSDDISGRMRPIQLAHTKSHIGLCESDRGTRSESNDKAAGCERKPAKLTLMVGEGAFLGAFVTTHVRNGRLTCSGRAKHVIVFYPIYPFRVCSESPDNGLMSDSCLRLGVGKDWHIF